MAKFTIYSPSGTALYTGTPSYTGQYMKPGMVEFREIAVPSTLELTAGCYVDYTRTGFRYRIYTVPQVKKQARSLSYGAAFVYQGVQLFDASKMLEYCPFRDLVLGDNRIHFSTQPSISTYEGCDGLARRLEACLRDQYDENGIQSWSVRIATADENPDLYELMHEPRVFTVSGVNLLEALDKIYEIWPGVGWVYKVENDIDTIIIGGGGINANEGTYAYGKGKGLTSLTRTVANADEMANRIYAYGASRNMLPRWYNNQDIKDADSVDIQNLMIPVEDWGTTDVDGDMLPDASKAYVEDAESIAKIGLRPTTVYFDGKGEYPDIYPTIRDVTIGMVRDAMESTDRYYPSTTIYGNPDARVDMLLSAQSSFDSGKAAEDGKSSTDTDYADISDSDSGSISAGSTKYEQIFSQGIVSTIAGSMNLNAVLNFSGSVDADVAKAILQVEFKINGDAAFMQNVSLQRTSADEWSFSNQSITAPKIDVAVGDTVSCVITLVLTNSNTSSVSYSYDIDGTYSFKMSYYREKNFTVTIRQVGFDIGEQAALGDGKTVAMRSGKCQGRAFAINEVHYDQTNDAWVLDCWRSEDESLSQWFPNTDYPVEAGDEFVLLDIAMPEIYISFAEQKLLTAAEELLSDTATERWQFIPEIDAKFMVENALTIRAGEYMAIIDPDIIDGGDGGGLRYFRTSGGDYFLTANGDRILLYGSGGVSRALVDTIVINEGEAVIPIYKVTLRDRRRKTWTESESPIESSSKSVGNKTDSTQAANIDLSNYVTLEQYTTLSNRVSTLESESFFMLDTNGNVTLKASYNNLWVPGWMAAGGVGSSGGSGGGVDLDRVWLSLTNNTDKPNVEINVAHIPDITTSKISNLETWIAGKGYITSGSIPNEQTVAGWGFTKNTGTVTSVALISGTGITVTNSGVAITTSGSRTIGISSTYQTYISNGNTAYGWGDHAGLYLPLSGGAISGSLQIGTTIWGTSDTTADWSIDNDGSAVFDNISAGFAAFSSLYIDGNPVDWFSVVTVNGSPTLKLNTRYAGLWASGWISAGGIGSGGGGGGSSVSWGTESGYTVPLTVEGVSKTILLNGALTGYATQSWVQSQGYLTSHQSLSNYVTLDGTQTVTGQKTFTSTVYGKTSASASSNSWFVTNAGAATFTGNLSVGGTVSVAGKDMIDLTQNGLTMFGFGSRAERTFNAYGTAVNLRACDANGNQTNILSVQNGLVAVGSKLIPSASGFDLGGSSSSQRWNTIYGVGANLTGDLALASTSKIDLGPVRLVYDSSSDALHITTNDSTNHPLIGMYADGFVASGGIGSSGVVKYVHCATQADYTAISTKDESTIYMIGTGAAVYLGTIRLYSES